MADRHTADRHPEMPDEVPMARPDEPARWLDHDANIKKIVWAVVGICAFLLLIDPFVHKHGPFAIEHLWGFYGIYSFVGCVALVLGARVLRRVVMRDEGYYDGREGADADR